MDLTQPTRSEVAFRISALSVYAVASARALHGRRVAYSTEVLRLSPSERTDMTWAIVFIRIVA